MTDHVWNIEKLTCFSCGATSEMIERGLTSQECGGPKQRPYHAMILRDMGYVTAHMNTMVELMGKLYKALRRSK